MKYTLNAKSLIEIEVEQEGITITETSYLGENSWVFISNDRIEDIIGIFQDALTKLKEVN